MEFIVLNVPYIDILSIKLLSGLRVKLYLFSFKITRLSFPKEKLVLVPVVKNELFLLQL